jgi:putative transposase
MRKIKFENGNFYHVYNRGVEKRQIFMDDQDYSYFLYELSEFNKPTHDFNLKRALVRGLASNKKCVGRFVEILCYVLMPNHYHLILRQVKDKGISTVMHRSGTGYTMYFNKKYERSGSLFQGTYKAKPIESDEYLMYLSRYLHLNPVSIISPDWKEKGIRAWKKTKDFLKSYKWSSFADYLGTSDTRGILNKEFIMDYFKNSPEKYENFITSWTNENKIELDRGLTSITKEYGK